MYKPDSIRLTGRQREQRQAVLSQLHQSIQAVRELPNGYACCFAADPASLLLLAAFIELERRCLPNLSISLDVVTEHGPAWLQLTGPRGTKARLRAALRLDGDLM